MKSKQENQFNFIDVVEFLMLLHSTDLVEEILMRIYQVFLAYKFNGKMCDWKLNENTG